MGALTVVAAAAGIWLISADDIAGPPPRTSDGQGLFSAPRRLLGELRAERPHPAGAGSERLPGPARTARPHTGPLPRTGPLPVSRP